MLPAVPPPHLRHPGRSAAESRDLDPVRSGERSRVKPGRADEQGLIRNIIKFFLTYCGLYAYIRPVSTRGRGVCSVLMRVGNGGRREEGSHAPLLVRRPKSQGLAGRQPVSNPGCSVPFAAPCCLIRLKPGWWLRAGQGRAAIGPNGVSVCPPGSCEASLQHRARNGGFQRPPVETKTSRIPRPAGWGTRSPPFRAALPFGVRRTHPAKPRTREGGGIWGVVGMLCQIEQPNPLLLRSDAASHRVSKDEGSSRLGGRGQRALVLRDADPRGSAPQDEGAED